ncbi:DinB family protein [Oceanobacillus halophilus]|uniref:DinB family protein n=1 Tax=Oceanobacillus halophilus TaxID=930130 RepID=A0A495A4Z8_9BACI|nr:DinB family protein [Oceanobacillus halophilus]RKQ34737.1 DinB family protein [Oceanobacillus halophilus]
MKSNEMETHFQMLILQRQAFYQDKDLDFEQAWVRPLPEKWSIGETLYHLFLMVRLFRRFSNIYIPTMLPLAYARRRKPYQTETHNIYEEYNQKKKKPMNAPSLIVPPSELEKKWNITEIQWLLEYETEKIKTFIKCIGSDVAGHIYYPDPVAYYPNLVQCIHLLAIHEQHHFDLTKKYYSQMDR